MKVKFRSSTKTTKYKLKAKVWKYKGAGGWHFITLPKGLSEKIRRKHGLSEEGWGRLKTTASIGEAKWNTAIWFDSKFQSYLLPIKSSVRKTENIGAGISVTVELNFQDTAF